MDKNLIRIINKIQDAFSAVGLTSTVDLPQIVVVGSQSSGKSSVLENIVGRDFLPRGSGIVTRRPLVLQLINRGGSSKEDLSPRSPRNAQIESNEIPTTEEEWGEFLHLPNKRFYDFNEIRKEIIRDTETKTGGNKGISDQPIHLRIYSPHVLTLTLVDLPGITKVPVGDQPPDIEAQIRDMIMNYISKPNAIILAVSAANSDLANSDALKLSREVDCNCRRTIGVLTKIDLMDENTDVVDILAGRVIPLQLGYVPVINRSQKDIDTNKPIRAAVEAEQRFFCKHRAYMMKSQYCGTQYLCQKLNSILMFHIKELLPEIKQRIVSQASKVRAELMSLGESIDDTPTARSNIVLTMVTAFCNAFNETVTGSGEDITPSELAGGARISHLFHVLFRNHIDHIDPFDQVKDVEIRTTMHNSSGFQAALFSGATAFIILLKQQIKRLEDPSVRCVNLAHEELSRIALPLLQKPVFRRFPELRDRLQAAVIAFLRDAVVPTQKLVCDIIAAEMAYINTAHPDLITTHAAIATVAERLNMRANGMPANQGANPMTPTATPGAPQIPPRVPGAMQQPQQPQQQLHHQGQLIAPPSNTVQPKIRPPESSNGVTSFFAQKLGYQQGGGKPGAEASMDALPAVLRPVGQIEDHERLEIDVVKYRLECYFNIVKRTVKDLVPKSIMLNLVLYAQKNLQAYLLAELYRTEVMNSVIRESDDVVQRRRELQKLQTALENAEYVVKSIN